MTDATLLYIYLIGCGAASIISGIKYGYEMSKSRWNAHYDAPLYVGAALMWPLTLFIMAGWALAQVPVRVGHYFGEKAELKKEKLREAKMLKEIKVRVESRRTAVGMVESWRQPMSLDQELEYEAQKLLEKDE